MLVDPIVGRRVAHVHLAFPNGIETFECRHEFAGGVQLDGKSPFGRRRNLVGEALSAGSQSRKVLRPCRDEAPFT